MGNKSYYMYIYVGGIAVAGKETPMITASTWVIILIILIVVAVILLIALNRSDDSATTYKPPATPPAPKTTFTKPPATASARPVTPVAKPRVAPPVGKHTTVYEYVPTRGVVRCRHCDGESPYGSAVCCICGNYINS